MNLFDIICGACSIIGLLVSLFTASKVIKISNTINYGNDSSRVANKLKSTLIGGDFVGRDK